MTRTRLIVALLALVVAVGQLACAVHPDGETAYRTDSEPGVLLASAHEGSDCDAQPAFTLVSRQMPDLAIVAGAALHPGQRLHEGSNRSLRARRDTPTPGISSPLRL